MNKVRSVRYFDNGLKADSFTIHSFNNSYNFSVSSMANARQIYQEFENAIDNYRSQNPPQLGILHFDTPDITDQIKKLAQLRDEGILTEEEFQAKKTDLLSRM